MCKFSKQRETLQKFVSTLKSLPTLIKLQLLKMQIFYCHQLILVLYFYHFEKFLCAIFGEAIKNKPVRM